MASLSISRFTRTFTALFLVTALFTLPTLAQESDDAPLKEELSNTEGLMLNATLGAQSVTSASLDDADGGGSFGIKVGYGFSRLFTLYAGLDLGSVEAENSFTRSALMADEYGFAVFEIGGQFHFRTDEKLVPFFDVALFGMGMGAEVNGEDYLLSGAGLNVGGGVKYFISPVFALNGGLYIGNGTWDELERGGDTQDSGAGYSTGQLKIGISWFPFQN